MSDEPGFAGSSSTAAAGLASSSPSTDVEEQSAWRARQLAAESHRNRYMDDLIRSLDLLTFVQIATVYFLE
jgi:hypothetical protein